MQIELVRAHKPKVKGKPATWVVFAGQQKSKKVTKTNQKKDETEAIFRGLDKASSQDLSRLAQEQSFKGAKAETLLLRNFHFANDDDQYSDHLLVVGLGDMEKINNETFRSVGGSLCQFFQAQKLYSAHLHLDQFDKFSKKSDQDLAALCEGLELADYEHTTFKSNHVKKTEVSFAIVSGNKSETSESRWKSLKQLISDTMVLTECTKFARWLGDCPGNKMTPAILAKETQKAAQNTKLKVTVWDKARLTKEKMGGLLGVSLGSAAEPKFIIMEYKGAAASKKPVCFVGKGLTFDSGGISIKPSAGMDEMKYDMCGGTAVIGAMLAIARLGLKVNVVGYVPSSENMPGPLANKPGDILTARNGKTVEVLNTDAEGRLILMDALAYASEQKPAAIFDAATLTGAIIVALANVHTGVFSRDEKLVQKIQKAANETGEKIWTLPIDEEHVKDVKGTFADLANIASHRGAGSSTASAFLSQFVDEDIPWAHFDIAGTAWNCSNRLSYVPKKGATGVMVRTFVELAKQY